MHEQTKAALDFRVAITELKEKQIELYRTSTLVLLVLLVLCVIAMTYLAKVSKVEPFLLAMDKRTGEVSLPQRMKVKEFTPTKNMIRHSAANFVRNWMSYSSMNIKKPFNDVLSMSDPRIINQYKAMILKDNPKSPVNTLGRSKYRDVTIHSISTLDNPNMLDIRYSTTTKEVGTDDLVDEKQYRAVLKWVLVDKKRSVTEWDANPIGFTVLHFDNQLISQE
jgi:type IV secretion system protein VirB8